MKYQLFFFKENNRYLDLDELFSFFSYCPFTKVDATKDEVEVKYYNESIDLEASFHLTKVSKVPDIYRLDPKYLDLDIYLSFDPIMPLFKVGIILDLVSDLCQKFNFFVYNFLFDNVSPFRKDLILRSYEIVRNAYRDKFPMEYTSLTYIPKAKVNDVFKYLFERQGLTQYYKNENMYFPVPKFIKGTSTGQVYLAVDFVEEASFVFPPQTDLIFYHDGDTIKTIYFDEFASVVGRYLTDLPGFIHNTKIFDLNAIKKTKKALSKAKFSNVGEDFTTIELGSIIDF